MAHFFLFIRTILTAHYPYSRWQLLWEYFRLVARSIVHHKLGRSDASIEKQIRFFGYRILFIRFGELINQVEEIFIRQIYHVTTANEHPIILDAGSNIGLSILYFKMIYPQAIVYGFEPNPSTFALLSRNVAINRLTQVELNNVALWSVAGKSFLASAEGTNSLQSSLLRKADRATSVEVETRKLSDWITGPIDLLKIDVEGAELYIVHDLITENKLQWVGHLVVEFHPNLAGSTIAEFVGLLQGVGMKCDQTKDVVVNGSDFLIYARGSKVD